MARIEGKKAGRMFEHSDEDDICPSYISPLLEGGVKGRLGRGMVRGYLEFIINTLLCMTVEKFDLPLLWI